jgi:hypothetical protein
MEQTVFMGRGNSKAEFLGFRGRRQAAATDCDISLPEVRSTEIIRAVDLTRVAAGERLVLCGSVRIGTASMPRDGQTARSLGNLACNESRFRLDGQASEPASAA